MSKKSAEAKICEFCAFDSLTTAEQIAIGQVFDMKKLSKTNIIRLVAVIVFLAITVVATIFLIPFIKNMLSEQGRIAIQAQVEAAGPWGWLLFLALQILQVIVALIPGEPVEIVGGVLFGTFGGLALCMLGLIIGTVLVYYLVKVVGTPLVFAFVDEKKFHELKFLQNERRLTALIFLLFLVPGTPKDTLTYLVPLTPILPWKFFVLSALARIPSVISSTFLGSSLGSGNWVLTVAIFLLTAVIGLVGIYFNDRFMKKFKKKK